MKSHNRPQHNAGVYATQPTGAPQKTPLFLKRCAVGFMAFQHLVWYETDLVFLQLQSKRRAVG